jgi:hypothetical protein
VARRRSIASAALLCETKDQRRLSAQIAEMNDQVTQISFMSHCGGVHEP